MSAIELTRKILEEIMGDFIALTVCPKDIREGDTARLVVWFPNFVNEQVSIGNLREFVEIIGPQNTETGRTRPDGSCCIIIDFKPESENDVMESISEINAAVGEIFNVRSSSVLLGDDDYAKFLKDMGISSPPRVLH